jgi:peptide/nickel transport system permease protein
MMSALQPVLLWSDLLLWLLVVAGGILGHYSRRFLHLRRAWNRLGKNGLAMGMAALLCAFLAVGLLDSLHYRLRLPAVSAQDKPVYAVEVLSALDGLLADLKNENEKTYSAPFATRLYAMDTLETPEGALRVYSRLQYGGAHLASEDALAWDVAWRTLTGIALAVLLWSGVAGLVAAGVARRLGLRLAAAWRAIWRGETALAWHGVLIALGSLLLVFLPLALLAGHYHVFGTDKVGQDVFYQVLKSIRTALVIGLVTTLVMLPLAIFLGIVAGYFRGWADDLIQYVYTVLNSIPGVLLIAAAVLMMQVIIDTHQEWFATAAERSDLRLLALCAILGMTSWTGLARLLRGETLKLRELEYIQAARAFGVSSRRIITRHILPNLMYIVVIALVMDFSSLVLTEAVLSYVGIGVDPAMMSFGAMINNARMELSREPAVWWALMASFVFMFTLVLAANLFADAVRDAFDPRHE